MTNAAPSKVKSLFDALPDADYPKVSSSREWVYFIGSESNRRLIKIGSSKSVKVRLRMLQYSCPCVLFPMLILNCPAGCEYIFHYLFAEYRTYGEWFVPGDRLMEFLESDIQNSTVQVPDIQAICDIYSVEHLSARGLLQEPLKEIDT